VEWPGGGGRPLGQRLLGGRVPHHLDVPGAGQLGAGDPHRGPHAETLARAGSRMSRPSDSSCSSMTRGARMRTTLSWIPALRVSSPLRAAVATTWLVSALAGSLVLGSLTSSMA